MSLKDSIDFQDVPIFIGRTIMEQLKLDNVICYDRQMEMEIGGTEVDFNGIPESHLGSIDINGIKRVDDVCSACGFKQWYDVSIEGKIFDIDSETFMVSLEYMSNENNGHLEIMLHKKCGDFFESVESSIIENIDLRGDNTLTYMSNFLGLKIILKLIFDEDYDEYYLK